MTLLSFIWILPTKWYRQKEKYVLSRNLLLNELSWGGRRTFPLYTRGLGSLHWCLSIFFISLTFSIYGVVFCIPEQQAVHRLPLTIFALPLFWPRSLHCDSCSVSSPICVSFAFSPHFSYSSSTPFLALKYFLSPHPAAMTFCSFIQMNLLPLC